MKLSKSDEAIFARAHRRSVVNLGPIDTPVVHDSETAWIAGQRVLKAARAAIKDSSN